MCTMKKWFLKISQKLTGKQRSGSLFLNKVTGLNPAILSKKAHTQVFSCKFLKMRHRKPLIAAFDERKSPHFGLILTCNITRIVKL